jgi:CPA2 family monovalent cation:H+ antiporter-2
MTDVFTLHTLSPIIILLFLGVVTAVVSRAIRVSPIVGYLALGLALQAAGLGQMFDRTTIALLAELGVVFLLFDIGLRFALERVRRQASDIFAFGSVQVLFATAAISIVCMVLGMSLLPALLIGAVMSLSSTAVVERLISERHQQNCPVASTATSILIFQDVAAMFLLIIASSLGKGSVGLAAAYALGKAILAVATTIAISRLLVGPLLGLVARSRSEEVFTATALLIALAAAWATGQVGLSLTLGAFLGGLALAETPYRPVIASEVKPFRGLLLGFFFVSIGLSLDVSALRSSWLLVLVLTALLFFVKINANIAASRVFKWSVPGSTQLGFLIGQGSEFAFVILALPEIRTLIGESRASISIAVVALSMAVTPNVAEAGRTLAGRLRMRIKRKAEEELIPLIAAAPVIVGGMGTIGRTVVDGLIQFKVGYFAMEKDHQRLQLAVADGYEASFGDGFDLRLWEQMGLHERKVSVLTAPDFEVLSQTAPLIRNDYPNLKRFAVVVSDSDAVRFQAIGIPTVVDRSSPHGLDAATAVLKELGFTSDVIAAWIRDRTGPDSAATSLREMAEV